MQLSILQEKLEHRANGSTWRIFGFISQNGGLNIHIVGSLHSSSRQSQVHKFVPLKIQALKGNPRLATKPIAQLNVSINSL